MITSNSSNPLVFLWRAQLDSNGLDLGIRSPFFIKILPFSLNLT